MKKRRNEEIKKWRNEEIKFWITFWNVESYVDENNSQYSCFLPSYEAQRSAILSLKKNICINTANFAYNDTMKIFTNSKFKFPVGNYWIDFKFLIPLKLFILSLSLYTVKPLITNTSEEFIKCRLDNFSMSLYYIT